MRNKNKRNLDDLSVAELERLLVIKKREERQQRLRRMQRDGRVVDTAPAPPAEIHVAPETDNGHSLPAPPSAALVPVPSTRDAVPRFEDGDDVVDVVDHEPSAERTWSRLMSGALILVEVAAVFGLVYLGWTMFTAIGSLERETAEAQRVAEEQRQAGIPTIAPTPQLRLEQVVLPSGHTPPTEPGGGQFNFAEIPSNLLPLVQSQILAPISDRPPPTNETALRLIVPKLNIDHTIVQGTDWDALRLGVGQVQNGVTPGDDVGNLVLAAHNDIYGEIFRFLDQLEPGDEFQILTATQVHNYVISGWEIVEPTAVHVMSDRGSATATLISCYPYQVDTQRIAVFAERV